MSGNSSLIVFQRAEPQRLRQEALQAVPAEEHDELGLKLAAGSNHPRAWVGPPFVYDMVGGMQFQLLMDLGLREHHRFLDVGCGSLRLGRLALMYLLRGRYFGVEPDRDILNAGVKMHFGADMAESQVIAAKAPTFTHNTDFDFSFTSGPVDYIFAQSIASHTGIDLTHKLLSSIAATMHEDSIAMVTYIRCEDPRKSNTEDGWFYPECVTYTDGKFGEMARDHGLNAYRTVWPMSNIRSDGLITSQHPTILTKSEWKPSLGQRMSAALFEGVQKIN